jgi:hypothetical protein
MKIEIEILVLHVEVEQVKNWSTGEVLSTAEHLCEFSEHIAAIKV